jgi:hypothetical protein
MGIVLAGAIQAQAGTVFDSNVTEWSSSTLPGPTIFPIGGTGQINGGFVVTTSTDGAEIGLRAQLRTIGLLPQTNDGITATYFSPPGLNQISPARAMWNFDFDIDLRATNHSLADYTATLTITDRNRTTVTPINMESIHPTATLYQDSWNPEFSFLASAFPSFDPNASGVYSFDLNLQPLTFTGSALDAKIDVNVTPEPASVLLLGIGIAGMAGYGWRKGKQRKSTLS